MRAMTVTIILKGAIRENGPWSWRTDVYVLRAVPLMNHVTRTEAADVTVRILNVSVLQYCRPALNHPFLGAYPKGFSALAQLLMGNLVKVTHGDT